MIDALALAKSSILLALMANLLGVVLDHLADREPDDRKAIVMYEGASISRFAATIFALVALVAIGGLSS